ncbi:hypothetical protein PFLUOLIPICF7_07350 [Pseudomonas simiae]|nr:hypothetical protein PFLUOLIPICF7_07350 [Pseudomonas simiae]
MGHKKRRIQDDYMCEKCVIYRQLRMLRLDRVKDGRATVGIPKP